jgi:hypothetical protein
VSVLWAVPVVCAAVAIAIVAARARAVEDAAAELASEVRRLPEVRRPLAGVRRSLGGTSDLATDFARRHPLDEPPRS